MKTYPILSLVARLASMMLGLALDGQALAAPVRLAYSTYLGGTGEDGGHGIAVDGEGHAYVVGSTLSPDFPHSIGSSDGGFFVTKLNAAGTGTVYSRLFSGRKATGIAVDASGSAYVVGTTESVGFAATPNAWQTGYAGGSTDAFILKLSPDGSEILYATYLGGVGEDEGAGIAVDAAGNAYVIGTTSAADFGAPPSLDGAAPGTRCAFIAKLNPSGSEVVYLAFLSGSGSASGSGIAVDADGCACVTGRTTSPGFPTVNAWQPDWRGSADAYVAKLNPSGSSLLYSTYWGGSWRESVGGIAVDGAGNAYVTGTTLSSDFPVSNATQPVSSGEEDGYVVKIDPAGAVRYSTYLGGSLKEGAAGIAADSSGNVWVAGRTESSDFPTLEPLMADRRSYQGDAYVSKLDPAGALVYSVNLGSNEDDDHANAVAVDADGNAYVTGQTEYPRDRSFPTTAGAYQSRFADPYEQEQSGEAFVSKLTQVLPAVVNDSFDSRHALAGTRLTTLGSNIGLPATALLWWSWTAPADGHLSVTTAGSEFDTALAIYTGDTVSALHLEGGNDDQTEALTTSRVKITARAGTEYQITVGARDGVAGLISLNLELGVPPNDDLADRTTLSGLPASAEGTNVGATLEPGEPGDASTSVWWSWTSPVTGFVTLDAVRSSFRPLHVAVYTGDSVSELLGIASASHHPRLTWQVAAGTTYQLRVGGYHGTSGRIALDLLPANRPANDDFAQRTPLSGARVATQGSNCDATREPGEPQYGDTQGLACFQYAGGATVWWSWIAPTNGSAWITTAGSALHTHLAVFTGSSVTNLTLVAADHLDDPASTRSRVLATNLTAGTAYQIMIDTTNWEVPGMVALNISVVQPPRLSASKRDDGQFRIRLTGTLEQRYVLEVTANLTERSFWHPLGTNEVSANGTVDFFDAQAGGVSRRFYRAVEAL